jgi:hypothetical protein
LDVDWNDGDGELHVCFADAEFDDELAGVSDPIQHGYGDFGVRFGDYGERGDGFRGCAWCFDQCFYGVDGVCAGV